MDLHPCPSCGNAAFDRQNRVVSKDGELVSVYEGECSGCGGGRKFEFVLPDAIVPPTRPMSYGGDDASQVLDPGEFLHVSDLYAVRIPASPEEVSPEHRAGARLGLETAIAALREVLKFVPGGTDAVPESAFTSELGRSVYAKEPGRFRKLRLEAVLGAYTGLLSRFGSG